MTTFTTEDRMAVQIEQLEKISNEHFKEMYSAFHRKPMTQEQIDNMAFNLNIPHDITKIVRAVENYHGVKE